MATVKEMEAELFGELTVYSLSTLADCGSPDSPTSAGADFLAHVASTTAEAVVWERDENNLTLEEAVEYVREERGREVCDDAPDVYTGKMWSEFVDLAAWREDPSELGCDGSDMDQMARICLYLIAERLVHALLDTVDVDLADI